jgi:predicted component of type VI protein secretion system
MTLVFEARTSSSLRSEILGKIDELHGCIAEMRRYMDVRLRLNDMHGVMDASADIRELLAKAEALHGVAVALNDIERQG